MTDLPAGRELDALIAEKVMGHEIWKSAFTNIWADNTKGGTVAPYSTDIAVAWEVVEKLRERKYTFGIHFAEDWEVEISLNEGGFLQKGDTVWLGRSNTAPHAICLAALKAVS